MGSPRHRSARTGTVARLRTTLCTAALGIAGLVGAAVIATPADAIVGGSTVSNGKYPFVASLQTPGGDHFCGGSVISSYWVLTAAHCVAGAKPRDQVVVVGRTSLTDTKHGQRLGVRLIRVHPRYDGQTYDVALLKLSRSTWVRGIPLARSADNALEKDGTPLVIAGWGVTTPILGYPGSTTRLKRADVKAWSDSRCARTNSINGFKAATEMCADQLLTDSCYGDSGGPLFSERNGRLVQLGVVSYGLGCATPGFPGVYAEVNNSSIAGFIRSVTGVRVG